MANLFEDATPDWISRPGDSILALMRRRGTEPEIVASSLPGGSNTLRGLLSGEVPIDEPKAVAISEILGGTPEFWLRRQENFERALNRAVAGIEEIEGDNWLRNVPAPGEAQRGRLSRERRIEELRRRLAFYGVGSISAWEQRYSGANESANFRTSRTYSSRLGPVSLWLRMGEIAASLAQTASWNPKRLEEMKPQIRSLTNIRRLDRFIPRLRDLLAQAGVALVIRTAPSGCRASGASRMIEPDRAMLLLSLRHRSDDHLWFTVFHEIGHLLLHTGETFIDGDETPRDTREEEADQFAVNWILPKTREREMLALRSNYRDVTRFAVAIGVAPGIIVGQLQHRGALPRNQLNFLKRRYTREEVEAASA